MAFLGRVPLATLLAVCCLAAPLRAREQRTATAEDDIKATFLLNFTRFVEWPAPPARGPFQICTVAEPAFDNALGRVITGESIDGRAIVRVTPETPEAAHACHILFLSKLESPRADRWIAALRGLPVLIVGESKAATDAGAAITFVVDDNRVKFDVNDRAAARAGLKISAKLLRVARNVTTRTRP